MDALAAHPRLVPGTLLNYRSPIATDMSQHIDWNCKNEAILDEPLTSPPRSCIIVRVDGVDGAHVRARFVVAAADYLAVTVRDFLLGLDLYLHHVPDYSASGDPASEPELRLADARALADTQYDVDEAFARLPDVDGDLPYCPPKSVSLPGLDVTGGFLGLKPHTPINKRAIVQWLQGRSLFAGVEQDLYNEAMLIVSMRKPEEAGMMNHPLRVSLLKGYQRVLRAA